VAGDEETEEFPSRATLSLYRLDSSRPAGINAPINLVWGRSQGGELMARSRGNLAALCALVLSLVGCYTNDRVKLVAPKHVEVYETPPQDDPRFSKPIEFPKNLLNKDDSRKNSKDDDKSGLPSMRGVGGMQPGM